VLHVLLKIPVDQIGMHRNLGRGVLFLDYDQVNGNDRLAKGNTVHKTHALQHPLVTLASYPSHFF